MNRKTAVPPIILKGILTLLAVMIGSGPARSEDNEPGLRLNASVEKSEYAAGEPIHVYLYLMNSGDTAVSTPPLSFSTISVEIDNGWKRTFHAERGPDLTLEPGDRTEPFRCPVVGEDPLSNILKPGVYRVTATYLGSLVSNPLSIRVKDLEDEIEKEKYRAWEGCWTADRGRQTGLAREYVQKYRGEDDFISYRMKLLYLRRGIFDGMEPDKHLLEQELNRAVQVHGATRVLIEYKAFFEKDRGNEFAAIRTMSRVDVNRAVDWLEQYTAEENVSKGHDMAEAIRAAKELEVKTDDETLKSRIRAIQAQAYYNKGDLRRAIRIMRPIVPEDAEKWEQELNQR